MSKVPNKTSYEVVLKSGEVVDACCGPAVVALGDAVRGYMRSENKIQCQNRPENKISSCPVRAIREIARKKTEERIAKLRRQASLLCEEADRLERRINN